jgi:hypothetical protein
MNLFTFTIAGNTEDRRAMRSLVAIRVGSSRSPTGAFLDIAIGDPTDATPSRAFTIGWQSLIWGAVGVFAVNAMMGCLSGSLRSMADVFVDHFDPSEGTGPKGIFVASFLTHAIGIAIVRRAIRDRRERFMAKALGWESVDAGGDDNGPWIVGPGELLERGTPRWTLNALLLWARNDLAFMTSREFSQLEERLTGHGCVLRQVRMTNDGRGVITTRRFGQLHSVGDQSAYRLMSFGETLVEEWYRDGQRVPKPASTQSWTSEKVSDRSTRHRQQRT